jgi:hypothetical protein
MSSRFWTFVSQFIAGTIARAEHVNSNMEQIDTGFARVATEMNRTPRFEGDFEEADLQIAGNAAARANKVIGFDDTGNGMLLLDRHIRPRGAWTTNTGYLAGDVVQATNTQSLYYTPVSHTSGTFSVDLAAGLWVMLLDNTTAFQAARDFKIVTAAASPYLLTPGDDIFADVTSGPLTLTLPANPVISMQSITVAHVGGDITANPVTIARNGQLIMGLAENMTVNTTWATFELAFCDAARGWRLARGT